jgi:Family of unknown function (DUF6527)
MLRKDLLEINDEHIQIGDWCFTDNDSVIWLVIPVDPLSGDNGGKTIIRLPIAINGISNYPYDDKHPTWDWDGNKEKPTLSPSIRTFGNKGMPDRWHGFLRQGKLITA